ncbi:MAG: hypothetical protein PHO14_08820 [Kiritimatiellae bacterium]|jgi:hypothetical protein|nr:hypothetical protein [Kiritimatiellia bacterium]MDD4342318.1 hypothetical protein [Kiritimatiellia bacterium]MDY0149546.1 hypothetical protein [Kiritimatiellia bacterium]
MSKSGWNTTAGVVVAALILATLPAAPVRAEIGGDSAGAAVTVGLLVAVVAVYGLVALRSDVERYSAAEREDAIARAVKQAEDSPLVLQAVTVPLGRESGGAGAPTEVAGATIGWRVTF